MQFFLGTHRPHWLRELDIPLFVSRRTLAPYRALPRALGPWALDSGGFSELSMFGAWRTSSKQYAAEVERFSEEVGNLAWAAPQDWMCEEFILKKTRLTIADHQELTVNSYLELQERAPWLPWVPVLQGWTVIDYWRHWAHYDSRGIDLSRLPLIAIGSICRRQGTAEAVEIIGSLAKAGLKLHGFGFKKKGIEDAERYLVSADSMAWSRQARYEPALPGCTTHKNCANCQRYALRWRDELLGSLSGEPFQESLLWQLHGETRSSCGLAEGGR